MSSKADNLPKGFSWVSALNGSIPPNAVVAGKEKSAHTLYIARVTDGNATHIGKCGQHIRGAVSARGGREHFFSSYEVLCGNSHQLKWVEQSGALDIAKLQGIPVVAGSDANGAALFVSRVRVAAPANGGGATCSVGLQPGMITSLMNGASVAYNGAEYISDKYEVLVVKLGSIYWAASSGGKIPADAIATGHENDSRLTLYTARALFSQGCTSTQVGKVGSHLGRATFAFAGTEVNVNDVEVLVGDPNAVRWVAFQGQLDLQRLNGYPLAAGTDTDGAVLYPARVNYSTSGVQPGKISTSFVDGIHFGADFRENTNINYEVLCYK